jgi:HEAT repeat protein
MKRLLIVGLLFVLAGCQQEATFQGRPTSYWIGELKSPWYMARVRAANALSQLGPEAHRAIPDLIELLDDGEPLVRWAAASTLAQFGPASRDALPALQKLAKDPDPHVRDAADWAIDEISRPAKH